MSSLPVSIAIKMGNIRVFQMIVFPVMKMNIIPQQILTIWLPVFRFSVKPVIIQLPGKKQTGIMIKPSFHLQVHIQQFYVLIVIQMVSMSGFQLIVSPVMKMNTTLQMIPIIRQQGFQFSVKIAIIQRDGTRQHGIMMSNIFRYIQENTVRPGIIVWTVMSLLGIISSLSAFYVMNIVIKQI